MNDKELIKKCESCDFYDDNDLMANCRAVLTDLDECKEELGLSEEEAETYLKMVENLKPQDVSKVLTLALKIRESGKIKNPEIKNDASRLIRAIEMS
ncbi:MAG: hypothetical protein ISP01_09465 [Methanobrevibacter arboriphilus]|jgi:hypothetical protein|uniref:Uncharacterized protein n=2 Tax=Methanobrevibacter arboriphilus TaxID=39441 RepID=A0ACA8R696_METAZ|nr:hypothetical protein [Methanobrevibacter arboriphilus]MBF4469618.1 hypothetical protein [Methanobrevibacter arboriphilus]MCC7561496.1 hypothetical protein [Methanobrevibacter arboriphilus]BBL62363.1 hypothetical protein MarbSA_14030 [Methanobrevibacter arboriphilus]GLI11590.1 hypothetical protein MARBORIA2_06800 [Methanobrevibacter arboriphilus]